MKDSYLEVTFHHGRPMAAYLYLPRQPEERSCRSQRVEPGLVIDFAADGRAIGIEITAPGRVSLADINRVLADQGLSPLTHTDLAPLKAA